MTNCAAACQTLSPADSPVVFAEPARVKGSQPMALAFCRSWLGYSSGSTPLLRY